ncbi:MAG TPA: ATP-binding cassette domain-containing protein [Gemmatimonadaceae bacterium]|nr:ATP-binding cassette domain-containing protein [Gemmatimonadaceae bacterium]
MVELRDVSYRAGGTRILQDVSVAFRASRFNVILGPNGAGKSTLLRLATGLATPTRGQVLYDQRPLAEFDAGELARMRAVLSQHVDLAFPLPTLDVAMMGRYPHYNRVPTAHDRDIVRRALEMVGMSHKAEQPYPTLSGGEQQKVQLARVLAQIWNYDEPAPGTARPHRFLFLDEPTSSLDVHYQIALLDVARSLLDYDCTVVAILHDLNVALEYGTHFVLLEKGRIALEAEDPDAIGKADLERIFQVRARRLDDNGRAFWRFGL